MNNNLYLTVYENYLIFDKIFKLSKISKEKQLIFLCVGNSKIWFDSFGPIVGSILKLFDLGYYIYGNTKSNITSNNLNSYIEMIYRFHNNPYIVVFDNAISKTQKPMLKIKEEPIYCSVLKNSVLVGDMSVTYCVNSEDIKHCENYEYMLISIKKIVRMIYFVLKS